MSTKTGLLRKQAEDLFGRIDRYLKGVEEKHMIWRSTEVSNNLDWILNHMCWIANISLPRILNHNQDTPLGWPENYREINQSLEEYKVDFASAKKIVMFFFEKLTDDDLEEKIPLWRGEKVKREKAIFNHYLQLSHHNGQIGYLKGTVIR